MDSCTWCSESPIAHEPCRWRTWPSDCCSFISAFSSKAIPSYGLVEAYACAACSACLWSTSGSCGSIRTAGAVLDRHFRHQQLKTFQVRRTPVIIRWHFVLSSGSVSWASWSTWMPCCYVIPRNHLRCCTRHSTQVRLPHCLKLLTRQRFGVWKSWHPQ